MFKLILNKVYAIFVKIIENKNLLKLNVNIIYA